MSCCTFEGLSAAQTAHRRLKTLVAACREANAVTPPDVLEKARADFRQAVDDDLNIPLALGVLWTLLKNPPAKDIYETALAFDKVLGLSLDKAQAAPAPQIDDVPDEIRAIAEERFAARKAKDWAKSDALRDELAARGYAVVDAKDSYTIKKA